MNIRTGLNKLSNPSFEITEDFAENDSYGWSKFQPNKFLGNASFVDDGSDGTKGYKITCADVETNKDGYYFQRISCSYQGFKYHLDIDAKLENATDSAEIIIWQRNAAAQGNLNQIKIPVTATTYQTYSSDFEMVEGSGCLDIFLHVANGSATFDNARLFKRY